jgi:hypothetical protein
VTCAGQFPRATWPIFKIKITKNKKKFISLSSLSQTFSLSLSLSLSPSPSPSRTSAPTTAPPLSSPTSSLSGRHSTTRAPTYLPLCLSLYLSVSLSSSLSLSLSNRTIVGTLNGRPDLSLSKDLFGDHLRLSVSISLYISLSLSETSPARTLRSTSDHPSPGLCVSLSALYVTDRYCAVATIATVGAPGILFWDSYCFNAGTIWLRSIKYTPKNICA